MFFWIQVFLLLCSAQQKTIVGLGDSWVDYDNDYGTDLGTYCKGKDMWNAGVSGSTAAQWAAQSCGRGNCNARSILSGIAAIPGVDITEVWLSVGGNDLLQRGIFGLQGVANSTKQIGAQIRSVVPDVKIFILGYSISGLPFGLDAIVPNDGAAMNLYDNLNEQLKSGAAEIDATYIETLENVLQGNGVFGNPFLFVDAIHMNQAGYCNIWTQDAFQKYMECEPETYLPCLPTSARSIECICYEGNNCENDCTNGGVCTLLEDSRAPVCLLPSDETTNEAETTGSSTGSTIPEETTSESSVTTRVPDTTSTSAGISAESGSPTLLPSPSPIAGRLTTSLPETSSSSTGTDSPTLLPSPSGRLTTSLSETTSTSLPDTTETTSAVSDSPSLLPSLPPSTGGPIIADDPITPSGISSTDVESTSVDSSTNSIISTSSTSPAISLEVTRNDDDNSEAWWMVVIILLSLISIVSILIAFYNWKKAKHLQDVYVLPVNMPAPKLSPPVLFSNMDKYSSIEEDTSSMDIRKTTSVSVSIYEIEEGTLPSSIMDAASRKYAPPLPPRKPGNTLSA